MSQRKIKNAKEMAEKWEEFKFECDNHKVQITDFSSKHARHVTSTITKSITYTIEGFCLFLGISRQSFYLSYVENPRYSDIVTKIREECELDARRKFETGAIPTQLAGLWMSKYGYTNKTDAETRKTVAETELLKLKMEILKTGGDMEELNKLDKIIDGLNKMANE